MLVISLFGGKVLLCNDGEGVVQFKIRGGPAFPLIDPSKMAC